MEAKQDPSKYFAAFEEIVNDFMAEILESNSDIKTLLNLVLGSGPELEISRGCISQHFVHSSNHDKKNSEDGVQELENKLFKLRRSYRKRKNVGNTKRRVKIKKQRVVKPVKKKKYGKTRRETGKVHLMCSNCGHFRAFLSLRQHGSVQPKCAAFPQRGIIIANTVCKIHKKNGSLVIRGTCT